MPIEEAPDDTEEEIHDTVLKRKPKLRRSVVKEPDDDYEPELPPVQEKKKPPPRTEKQIAALAKGREASRLKALERRKKKAEETLRNEETEPPRASAMRGTEKCGAFSPEEISTITTPLKKTSVVTEKNTDFQSDGWREFAMYLAKDRDERKASKVEPKKTEPPRPPTPPPIIEKPLPVLKKKAIFS